MKPISLSRQQTVSAKEEGLFIFYISSSRGACSRQTQMQTCYVDAASMTSLVSGIYEIVYVQNWPICLSTLRGCSGIRRYFLFVMLLAHLYSRTFAFTATHAGHAERPCHCKDPLEPWSSRKLTDPRRPLLHLREYSWTY